MKNFSKSSQNGKAVVNGTQAKPVVNKAWQLKAFLTQVILNRSKKTIRHAGQRRGGGNSN